MQHQSHKQLFDYHVTSNPEVPINWMWLRNCGERDKKQPNKKPNQTKKLKQKTREGKDKNPREEIAQLPDCMREKNHYMDLLISKCLTKGTGALSCNLQNAVPSAAEREQAKFFWQFSSKPCHKESFFLSGGYFHDTCKNLTFLKAVTAY